MEGTSIYGYLTLILDGFFMIELTDYFEEFGVSFISLYD